MSEGAFPELDNTRILSKNAVVPQDAYLQYVQASLLLSQQAQIVGDVKEVRDLKKEKKMCIGMLHGISEPLVFGRGLPALC